MYINQSEVLFFKHDHYLVSSIKKFGHVLPAFGQLKPLVRMDKLVKQLI